MNLYSKYRSQKFSEVVGQKHVVGVISNALVLNRVAHAYLFSGPRGTGKTTIARLLAKSLNCTERKKGQFESCNKCQSCKEISAGISMDIIEIDAASNRGIDEIRALRDKVRFAPSGKRFKIFIIDEVHMLTREAFNALLKTLEEPPKHAIFILATTELHKVPDTIISRTQQFDFHLHNLLDIIGCLKKISQKEKINIDDGSIRIIANVSRGGLRDAISLLDQVSNTSKKIDENLTREVLGLASLENLFTFIELLIAKDTLKLIKLCEKLYQDGVDFYEFVGEMIELLRKTMLYKIGYEKALIFYTEEEKKEIDVITKNINNSKIIYLIEELLKTNREIKEANISYLPLEIALFRLTFKEDENINNQIEKNKDVKEKKKEQLTVVAKTINIKNKKKLNTNTKNIILDINKLKDDWKQIIEKIASNHSLKIMLKNSNLIKIEDNKLVIGVEFKLYKDKLESQKIYQNVCACIEEYTHKKCQVRFVVDSSLVKELTQTHKNNEDNSLVSEAMDVFD